MTIYELGTHVNLRPNIRGKYDTISAKLLDVMVPNWVHSLADKRMAIAILYSLMKDLLEGNDVRQYSISTDEEFEKLKQDIDADAIYEYFDNSVIDALKLDWTEIDKLPEPNKQESKPEPKPVAKVINSIPQTVIDAATHGSSTRKAGTTPKEDLYLVSPTYPRLTTKLMINTTSALGFPNKMYQSFPVIPTKQSEISISTEYTKMTDRELLKLFPNNIIRTRHSCMYEKIEGVPYDNDLGLLFSICKYTKKQIKTNLIEYPHLYQIKRAVSNEYGETVYEPFELKIELEDGKLHNTSDVWETLPDARKLPNCRQYWKEYVIRRYLMERDIGGVDHKSKMVGALKPFLTLFAPPEYYAKQGYKDSVKLAQACVQSRVAFKGTRNGVVANKGISDCVFAPYCFDLNCSTVCPKQGQHKYLMDLNGLQLPLNFLSFSENNLNKGLKVLDINEWFSCVEYPDSSRYAKFLTYLAICNQWEGSAASAVVYNLNFAKYAEELTTSSAWSPSDTLQYMRIWAKGEACIKSGKPNTLIISGLDFITFTDRLCSELLQIIMDRDRPNFKTVVVVSSVSGLIGKIDCKLFSKLVKFLSGRIEK